VHEVCEYAGEVVEGRNIGCMVRKGLLKRQGKECVKCERVESTHGPRAIEEKDRSEMELESGSLGI